MDDDQRLCNALNGLFGYDASALTIEVALGNSKVWNNMTTMRIAEAASAATPPDEGNPLYNVSTGSEAVPRNEALEKLRFYITIIVMPILCLFGIGGNILNILVLTRRRMQASMDCTMEKAAYVGLIALALSDMLYCFTALPEAFKGEEVIAYERKSFWVFFELYGKYFQNAFSSASTWLTVIMAASRYAAICHPLHAREFIKASTTIVATIVTFIFWALLDIPYLWTYKLSEMRCPSENSHQRVYYMLDTGALNKNTNMKHAFTYTWTCIGFFIPVVLLAYCNYHLIQALRESYRMRKEYRVHTRTQQPGTKITPTLIAIVVMFILLVTPSEVIQFTYFKVESSHTDVVTTLMVIFNAMHTLNFAINFVLYCVVNVHFRSTLIDLLLCCCGVSRKGRQRRLLKRQSLTTYTTVTANKSTYNAVNHQSVAESML